MCKVYGYARISRRTQNIERQIRNMIAYDSNIKIYQEAFTGTKKTGRKEYLKLLNVVKPGDTIVFDSVSRMSRNAAEGLSTYFELYDKGINLVFLKERHIDTEAYAEALKSSGINIDTDDTAEGNLIAGIVKALNDFMRAKVKEDIKKAFDQAQKEVDDLHNRTSEGLETAKQNGKQIGNVKGVKFTTKKSIEMKDKIRKMASAFDGNMSDKEVIETLRISRNTFYKYKKELLNDYK